MIHASRRTFLLIGIILIAFLARIVSINQSLWLDEAAQAIESARPLSAQFDISGDFQPPLFHLLLHFWMQISKTDWWLRTLPLSFGVGSVILSYFVARQMSGEKVALLTSILFALSPFHLWYSLEVRPYSLSVFIALLATYLLLRRRFAFYAIAAALSLYTMYLLPFMLFAHGVYLLFFQRKLFMLWVRSICFAGLLFLPWVPSFMAQLGIGTSLQTTLPGWSDAVSTPLLKALPLTFLKFMIGRMSIANKSIYALLALLFAAVIGMLSLNTYKVLPKLSKKLIILFLSPILFAFCISIFIPILAPQRVLYCLPFLLLFIAQGLVEIKKTSAVLIFTLLLTVSIFAMYNYTFTPAFQREDWRLAVSYIQKNQPGLVLFIFPDAFAPWQWYSLGKTPSLSVAPNFVIYPQNLSIYASQIQRYNRLYVFNYLSDLTDPRHELPVFLLSLGYTEQKVVDISGVGFITTYEKVSSFN